MSTHSEAYKKIRSGELRLLDVILQLNGQDVTDSLRKAFAEEVKEMHSLHITVSRSISVPCTDSFLWERKLNLNVVTMLLFLQFSWPYIQSAQAFYTQLTTVKKQISPRLCMRYTLILCRYEMIYSSLLLPVEKKTTAYVFALRNPKAVYQSDREFGITVTMPLQVCVEYHPSSIHSIFFRYIQFCRSLWSRVFQSEPLLEQVA